VLDVQFSGPYPVSCYRVTGKPVAAPLPEAAVKAISQTVRFIQQHSDAELNALMQHHARSWREGKEGEELVIYTDLIPDAELAEREQRLAGIEGAVAAVFGGTSRESAGAPVSAGRDSGSQTPAPEHSIPHG